MRLDISADLHPPPLFLIRVILFPDRFWRTSVRAYKLRMIRNTLIIKWYIQLENFADL
jgi:hypothetical protein